MCNILKPCDRGWAEPLPEACPPVVAEDPAEQVAYRLIAGDPPTPDDFQSQRNTHPDRHFNVSECVARSVSVWSSIERARALRLKSPHQGKKIAAITLVRGTGVVTRRKAHISWWRCLAFDAVANSQVIE